MKSHIYITLAVSLLCFTGCGHNSTVKSSVVIPDDSFRITVADVFSSEDERVSFVTVEARESQRYCVRAQSAHLGDGSSMERVPGAGLHRERVLMFVASRISPNGSKHDYIKAILRRGDQVTMTDMREFPQGTPLAQMVALTIHDGIYPLSKPLVIGRLYGEDLLLTVGDTRSEAAKR